MKIIVAGAGAGKTTSMATEVIERYRQLTDSKIIYVITYTNAAKDHIKNKLTEELGAIPSNIKVETSHAFLLHELIIPFHRLLYETHFSSVSLLNLPTEPIYKARKLQELHKQNIIHVDEVTKTAKYVLCGKSNDKIRIKQMREKIINILRNYLDSIFMDEAQDMDEHLSQIVQKLDASGFHLHLVGDPKQDLRGYQQFRALIKANDSSVVYLNQNHRCPDSHIMLANQYTTEKERQQLSHKNKGVLNLVYESTTDLNVLLNDPKWDYKYISKKQSCYQTGTDKDEKPLDSLRYELKLVVKKSAVKQFSLEQKVYILEKWILKKLSSFDNQSIMAHISHSLVFKFNKGEMRRLDSAIELNRLEKKLEGFLVHSIDKVKGLEGERCLFILTTDLSDYLFKIKTEQNKMMNYLYVALTRSKKDLTILITKEVEKKYGAGFISNWYT
ncbi:UvrD-helicase domain-containing protein [Solibacillus cecembensis]|uniref:UvrD-helicase domain-containing protein n=1 Tax=Solibacillus cecembensis TaxID=459347 RepID=UPI003CFEBCD6